MYPKLIEGENNNLLKIWNDKTYVWIRSYIIQYNNWKMWREKDQWCNNLKLASDIKANLIPSKMISDFL